MLVELEEPICPYCRSHKKALEEEQGPAAAVHEESPRPRRPILVPAGLVVFVVLMSAWFLRGYLFNGTWREFSQEVERVRDPRSHFTPRETAGGAASEATVSSFVFAGGGPPPPAFSAPSFPDPPPVQRPRETAQAAETAAVPPRPAAPPPAAPALVAPAPPSPNPGLRCWYGLVYDLATLRPIARAKVRFNTKAGSLGETATDGAGHYRFDLPSNIASAQVSVSIPNLPGYREGLLEDQDPPLRERSPDARKRIMTETTDNDLEPIPLRFRETDEVVELDLVLVPLARN
jgi:hypothetical protein